MFSMYNIAYICWHFHLLFEWNVLYCQKHLTKYAFWYVTYNTSAMGYVMTCAVKHQAITWKKKTLSKFCNNKINSKIKHM